MKKKILLAIAASLLLGAGISGGLAASGHGKTATTIPYRGVDLKLWNDLSQDSNLTYQRFNNPWSETTVNKQKSGYHATHHYLEALKSADEKNSQTVRLYSKAKNTAKLYPANVEFDFYLRNFYKTGFNLFRDCSMNLTHTITLPSNISYIDHVVGFSIRNRLSYGTTGMIYLTIYYGDHQSFVTKYTLDK